MRLILASASPRRREILARIAYPFEVQPADIDETRREGEAAEAYVGRLAREKATARRASDDVLVIGADTVVVCGEEVLGKPTDPEDAARMLSMLSGRDHQVFTGVAIARGGEVAWWSVEQSRVCFASLSDRQIQDYVATDESLDKAGAYALQGGAGAFVRRVEGDVGNVIGLPLGATRNALGNLGFRAGPPVSDREAIGLRFRAISGEIAARAVAAGRSPDAVRLVTVTKGHPVVVARSAIDAGARDLGENYVQEARAKWEVLQDRGVRWHLIGPLQKNKAGVAAEVFSSVHTIARVPTAVALGRRRGESENPVEILVQVNMDADPAKAGVAPQDAGPLLDELSGIEGIRARGLMMIGRQATDAAVTRSSFAQLRALRDELRGRGHEALTELSMGMSEDYGSAIEEGATMVRVGTAIVGQRVSRQEARST